MTTPTPEQQKMIDAAVKASQEKLQPVNNPVIVTVTGGGKITSSNPLFKIEHRKD